MKEYSVYKDSGFEWLGELPADWRIKRLKYLVEGKLEYGANEVAEFDDEKLPRYIRITDFGDDGNLRQDTFKSLTMEQAKGYFLSEGDVLFARSGATVGKTFQFKQYKGRACFAGYLIKARPNKNILLSDFLYLFTKSGGYENWKSAIFNQATIQNIGADKYQNIYLPVPSLEDQESISVYLNCKTTQIDDLIAKKERMIELLKEERAAIINQAVTKGLDPKVEMKDSDISWFGKMPKHWSLKQIKHVGVIRYGLGEPPEYVNDGLPFVRATDIKRGKINLDFVRKISSADVPWSRRPQLSKDEILVVRSGAYTGDSAIVTSDVAGSIAGYDMVLSVTKAAPRFIAWSLLADYLLVAQIFQARMRAAQPHLNAEELGGSFIFIPPLAEQQVIVDFLDNKIGEIDSQVVLAKKSMELLKEYRIALISEVVTGKIDVRED